MRWLTRIHQLTGAVFAVELVAVLWTGIRLIRRFDRQVKDNYSNLEGKSLSRLHYLLGFFVATSFLSFVVNMMGKSVFADTLWLCLPSVLFSILLFLLGYEGYKREFTCEVLQRDLASAAEPDAAAATDGEERSNVEVLARRIRSFIVDEKLYLQPNFKIPDLTERLHTNRSYVYQAINVAGGISFNELVNQLRIEHATHLLTEQPELSIQEVYLKSGYTSESSFYRNFKHVKGMTPNQWRQRHLHQ